MTPFKRGVIVEYKARWGWWEKFDGALGVITGPAPTPGRWIVDWIITDPEQVARVAARRRANCDRGYPEDMLIYVGEGVELD